MDRVEFNNLVAKAIAGDKDAMNAVIAESFSDIHFYARTLLQDADLAAEAAQDSCIEIIENIGKLRSNAAFVTWSRRIVYHQCISRVGASQDIPLEANEDGETLLDRLPDTDPDSLPQEVVENHELRDLVQGMLNNLPENQRSAIVLYHFQHYSIKEIAEIQGEKENTIKSRLFQGRRDVKKQVEAYEKKTGIKLHSVGVLPLLYFLFKVGKEESDLAAAAQLPKVQAALAPVIAKVAAGAGTVAAGAAITSTIGFKIGAAVIAAALVIGGVIIGTQSGKDSDEDINPDISYSEPTVPSAAPSDPATGDPAPGEPHPFQHYAFDDDAHWLICDCPDATDTRYAHSFANGECSVCRMPEPLPGGNPYLTYDTTLLGGHWLCMPLDTVGDAATEFYITGDGSLFLNGTTYYPVGSMSGAAPLGEPSPLLIHFRETPYDPAVGITEMEAYNTPIMLELKSVDDLSVVNLFIGADIDISGKYYRESDYFGYEKVELTMDNYQDYLTISIDPITCGYSSGTF